MIQVARKADISTRSLTAYESGAQSIPAATLERLADTLNFPVEFFSRPDLDEPSIDAVSFRAVSKLTARQREIALGTAALALELAEWEHQRFVLPEPNIPRLANDDPEAAAEAVRVEWGLGEQPIGNVIHLLEAHGVRVFSLLENSYELDAFSFWHDGIPYVFLNTVSKSAERSRMDAAHELGHLVMHRGHSIPHGPDSEREAQLFGSSLLMPRRSVLAMAPRRARLADLVAAKAYWSVAVVNLIHRMHIVEMLSDWHYRTLCGEASSRGYRTDEPNPIVRETSQVLRKVFETVRIEGMTYSDVAAELGIYVHDLNRLVFGLVPTAVVGTGFSVRPRVPSEGAQLRLL
jgi:Zn-dependent peptidase ImmA (M78 family)